MGTSQIDLDDLPPNFFVAETRYAIFDFDHDGHNDLVISHVGGSHYFSGSFFVLAPDTVTVEDALTKLYPSNKDGDEDLAIDIAKKLGWRVYAGGQPELYSRVDPRYVYVSRIRVGSKIYLEARPDNFANKPSAIVFQLGPKGRLQHFCTVP